MLHEILKDKKLILASASPRRQVILNMIGLNPVIHPSNVHEPHSLIDPAETVIEHSKHKVLEVAKIYDEETFIVGADTIVFIENIMLGKPKSKQDAKRLINILSGKNHEVYTGICIEYKNKIITDYEKTIVEFKHLSPDEIDDYILTNEPFDKAGGYGIQGFGSQFIKSVSGCYFNVMGFPVHLFYNMVKNILRD